MGKPFVETKHTRTVLDKIKRDLDTLMLAIRIASMVIFAFYYGYLIVSNVESVPHLVAYVVLFAVVVTTFVVEMATLPSKGERRKNKRQKLETRRFVAIFTKTVKYVAKAVTVTLALVESVNNPTSDWDLIFDVATTAILVCSVLFEVVTAYVNRCIDYFTLSVTLDYQDSRLSEYVGTVAKLTGNKEAKLSSLEAQLLKYSDESIYTEQETKIMEKLKKDADELAQQRNAELQARIVATKAEIKQKQRSLTRTEKGKIKKQYDLCKKQATETVTSVEKLDQLCEQAKTTLEILPLNVPELKYVPDFVSLIANYASKRYTDIATSSIVAIVAAIIYFVSPIDILPDSVPLLGRVDDAFVVNMVLKTAQKEIDKFVDWRNKQ